MLRFSLKKEDCCCVLPKPSPRRKLLLCFAYFLICILSVDRSLGDFALVSVLLQRLPLPGLFASSTCLSRSRIFFYCSLCMCLDSIYICLRVRAWRLLLTPVVFPERVVVWLSRTSVVLSSIFGGALRLLGCGVSVYLWMNLRSCCCGLGYSSFWI